ncbi:hypothetical protein NDU88_002380 [Pleurodeles waltl]|uniref:LRRCT domain-containing protein n=2 Tax=Pleurodeles waltl TaxID=8319 RepID=A0AAV7VCF3_PLEWA|nr:hypothetical protein NDU88_002380 [Pleurodeles waltl]
MRYIPQAFATLPNISRLSLEKNNIEAVGRNSFASQASLRALNLRKNRIWVIQKEAFINLNKLIVLNLGHNNISDLPNQLFEGLIRLKTMHLEANRLRAIHCAFSSLPCLRKLYLNNNHVAHIARNAFASLKQLEFLHLSRNFLTSIPHPLFGRLPKLRYVFLSHNPWKCDCNMDWLTRWNASYRGVVEGLHCASLTAVGQTAPNLLSRELLSCSAAPEETGDEACEETPWGTAHQPRATSLVFVVMFILCV